MDKMGQPMYGVINTGIFGAQIVAGIVTGVSFTEDKPIYELSFGKNQWKTTEITNDKAALLDMLNVAPLARIKETHGLKIKYEK